MFGEDRGRTVAADQLPGAGPGVAVPAAAYAAVTVFAPVIVSVSGLADPVASPVQLLNRSVGLRFGVSRTTLPAL